MEDASLTTAPPAARIAGLPRRAAAWLIDGALLGAVGWLIGSAAGSAIAPLGTSGRLLGLLVALPYFGVLGSRIGGGQTPGKLALRIRVVDEDGRPLSVARSFLRAIVLTVPWFVNGLVVSPAFGGPGAWALGVLAGTMVFGVGCGSAVLVLVNRRARQTVHDLAVRSYVVARTAEALPVEVRTPVFARRAVAGWLVATAVAVAVVSPLAKSWGRELAPAELQRTLAALPGVRSFSITQGGHHVAGVPIPFVRAVLWYDGPLGREEGVARGAAAALLRFQPAAADAERVEVRVVRGWDVGIAHMWRSHAYVKRPDEWRRESGP